MIKVENLCKSFGQKKVLCGVNLEAKDGETLVIIGGSGTGKSILLKNILFVIILPFQQLWTNVYMNLQK